MIRVLVAVALLIFLMPIAALAGPVTFVMQGTTNASPQGPLAVLGGGTFELVYTFDAALTADTDPEPTHGVYPGGITGGYLKITTDNGTFHWGIDPTKPFTTIHVLPSAHMITLGFAGPAIGGHSLRQAQVQLVDDQQNAFGGADTLPTELDLSIFEHRVLHLDFSEAVPPCCNSVGVITSVERVQPRTSFPWTQEGHSATHSGATASPAPASTSTLWTSRSLGRLGQVAAVAHGLVISQGLDGPVALDQRSGALVRTFGVPGARNPVVLGNLLIVGDEAGTVRAFDIATGALVWSRATGPINTIAADAGRVFVNTGIGDGRLRALDASTGALLWEVDGIAESSSPPTVAGGIVFQNSVNDGRMLAFDATTGVPVWNVEVGNGTARPVATATRLFFGTASGELVALSQATGAVLWATFLGEEVFAGGASDGLVFAVSFGGVVHALDADTGAVAWSFDTGTGFQSSALAAAGGAVFFSAADGVLFAFDESSGALLWSRSDASGPVVADGLVFAASSSGEVLAIGTPLPPLPPDDVPPDTEITDGPTGTITTGSATFEWTGSDDATPTESLVYATRLDPIESTFSPFGPSTSRTLSSLANGTYTLHVKARDEAGNEDPIEATQSFTVANQPPVDQPPGIRVVAPNGGEIWRAGSLQTISWTYVGNPGSVRIVLLKNGERVRSITPSTSAGEGGAGSFTWTVPAALTPGNDYRVRIVSASNPEVFDRSDANFTIIGPSGIAVLAPNGGESWEPGSVQTIRWLFAGVPGDSVRIVLFKNGVKTLTITGSTGLGAAGTGSFDWVIPRTLLPGANYQVRVISNADSAFKDSSDANFSLGPP